MNCPRATLEHTGRFVTFVAVFSLLFSVVVRGELPESQRIFYQDLHPFGFITEAYGRTIGSFTDIAFLSNDLLLVTVNTRMYGAVVPSFSDQPFSKLLV